MFVFFFFFTHLFPFFLLLLFPPQMSAYGEFRRAYLKDDKDERIVFYGIRYIIENYISRPWDNEDIENAAKFLSRHNAGHTDFPFPKELFQDVSSSQFCLFPFSLTHASFLFFPFAAHSL